MGIHVSPLFPVRSRLCCGATELGARLHLPGPCADPGGVGVTETGAAARDSSSVVPDAPVWSHRCSPWGLDIPCNGVLLGAPVGGRVGGKKQNATRVPSHSSSPVQVSLSQHGTCVRACVL